jgi:hypothetical protein
LINIQRAGGLILDPTDGRLKVIPKRDFTFNIPYNLSEGKHSYEHAPNPVNQLGALLADHVPVATSNDYASFMAAFNKRCNFDQADSEDDIDEKTYSEAIKLIDNLPDMFEPWDDNEYDRERWLAKFSLQKRKRMEDGYETIPFSDYKYIGTKDLSVKQEILLKRYDDTWAPRVINAGNDTFNAITGPAAMITMERFCAFLKHHKVGDIEILPAYKQNDVSILEFLNDPDFPETVEGDFSRNDSEQRSRVTKLIDHWLVKFNMPEWYRTLCLKIATYKVQNRQFGFTGKVRFQLPTGTTATTYRNSMYNATMFAVACKRQNRKGKATILGDDLLARLNRRLDLKAWVLTVADFKMVLKAKAPQFNGHATFLSRRIITDCDTPCMVPLIGKMLARFNARGTSNPAVSDESYIAGKSLSYAYECRHVPFLREYFLKRYRMHETSAVVFDELSWFTRSSGLDTLDAIVDAINNETALVPDSNFEFWLCTLYDSDLYELGELMDQIILNPEPELIDQPYFDKFKIDI